MSIKLTDTQLVMLSAAAQREDRCLVASATLNGAAAQKVAKKLISAGLAREVKGKRGDPIWRRDEESGVSYALKLTAAGAKAIGINESVEPESASNQDSALQNRDQFAVSSKVEAREAEPVRPGPSAPRGGSKLMQVIELLHRERGATIDELVAATSWLAHTTRAALTGLRKRGYAVAIDRSDDARGSFYCIETGRDGGPVARPAEEPPASATRLRRAERPSNARAHRAA